MPVGPTVGGEIELDEELGPGAFFDPQLPGEPSP
jgi:hypothetical protein